MSQGVTGQIIFRDSGGKSADGRKIYMVVGILALPEGEVKDHHQYTICGRSLELLTVPEGTEIDRSEICRGTDLEHLVTQPLWRV